MKVVRDTGLLGRRKLLETLRRPVWVIVGLSTPLLYLALCAPLLHRLAGGRGFPTGPCSTCSFLACCASWRSAPGWAPAGS